MIQSLAPHPTARATRAPSAIGALLVGVLAGVIGGCSGHEARRANRTPVTVARAESRSIPYELDASGTVEPGASADVTAQVGGLVTAIPFREGDDVRAGAVLVQLDPRGFETSVAQAEAVLARDRAQARSARLDLDR